MADSVIGITVPGSPNKNLDSEQLTVGANTVERERIEISGATALQIAAVLAADPAAANYGLVVRPRTEAASGAIHTRLSDGTSNVAVASGAPAANAVGLVVRLPAVTYGLNVAPTLAVIERGIVSILDGAPAYRNATFATTFKPLNAVAVNPAATIWTPANPGVSGAVRWMGGFLSGSVAGVYLFKDGAAGTTIGAMYLLLNGEPFHFDFGPYGILLTQGNILECLGPAASTVTGMVWGIEEGISV